MAQCTNQLARAYVHQLVVGRLETEQRVASFILALALRSAHEDTRSITVALPMSRDDIANYLVINCDTLSRTMMKFCDSGLIERESRHAIRIIDLEALKKISPLATLLSAVFMKDDGRPEIAALAARRIEPFTPAYESPYAILPPGAASALARCPTDRHDQLPGRRRRHTHYAGRNQVPECERRIRATFARENRCVGRHCPQGPASPLHAQRNP